MAKTLVRFATVILASASSFASIGVAQDSAPSVQEELVKIHAALEKIAALLARQSDATDLDLLMKRVQLGQSQAFEIERQISAAEAHRQKLLDEKLELEVRIEVNEKTQQLASERGLTADMVETLTRTWEEQLKVSVQRLAAASAQIAELQNRLAESSEAARGWQSVLDRRLAGH